MQTFSTEKIRNVVLLSHTGAGKTSLGEVLLFTSGAISRLGRVEDGTTTSDYEPEAVKRAASIQLSLLPCVWKDVKINVIDTPGYADFIGAVFSGLRVADGAVLTVAATSGVEVGTLQMWRLCEERGLPRFVFVNKLDRENADFQTTLQSIQKVFGKKCVALNLPVGKQQDFKGVFDLLDASKEPTAEVRTEFGQAREQLIEAIAETDDELATKYLEGETLTPQELTTGLKRGIATGRLVPVLAGSAVGNVGAKELLDVLVNFMPAPAEIAAVEASNPDSGEKTPIALKSDGPLAALVFKTTADPYVGKLSYIRVYSGTLNSDSQVWNVNKKQAERIGQLFVPRGKAQEQVTQLAAGDIGAVAKLSVTVTGDTLCQRDRPMVLEGVRFPEPMYSVAVHPKSKADLDKMSSTLARVVEEDPSLKLSRELDTGEVLLSGLGDVQMDVVAEKTKRRFGTELLLSTPKVPYKETIAVPTKVEYKHKKQTGGHGQYGHVFLELEPLPRGGGFEFGEKVVGGNVPREYIPAVEKGVVKALQEGPLAGFPIVDIRVTLYDGSYHPVDSSGMSFEIAGGHALRKGMAQANPVLVEPIMRVQITVPDSFTGDVMGDLNSKRARILGMTPQNGITVIDAEAPMAEMLRYATDLRALTQGRGIATLQFDHYEEVPAHLAQRIIEEATKERAAERA